jgi:hypothetical protein
VKVREWLAARADHVPATLSKRMEGALGERLDLEAGVTVEPFVEAAEELLHDCLDRRPGDAPRDIALNLLAADALMTYACEAAVERPDAELRARDVMLRVARVATP